MLCLFVGVAIATIQATFPGRRGLPIFLDDLECKGSESTLIDCPSLPLGRHNCDIDEAAGVYCPGRKLRKKDDFFPPVLLWLGERELPSQLFIE